MNLTDYVYGRDAAGLMRLSSADNVWRAVTKHGERYTAETGNAVEVVTIGTKKAVKRDQLEAFRGWYDTAVRYPARRPQGSAIRINPRRVSDREMAKRRLGVLIRRIQIAQGAGD
jgi:hypothetical protein